jgi:hypothetical protein
MAFPLWLNIPYVSLPSYEDTSHILLGPHFNELIEHNYLLNTRENIY